MNPEMCRGTTINKNAATPDQEVWVRNAVYRAIKMGVAINHQQKVGTDRLIVSCGLRGLAVGAAMEILGVLQMRPDGGYVNLGDFES